MADDSNRIGTSRTPSSLELLRPAGGIGAATSADTGSISAAGSGGASLPRGAYGPRGNRMLPADTPLDQLDRKAARGTYLDILV